ncbi:MAG: DUF1189 family protein [Vallitaleaceae bacterium]|nr:DUF1189 family protein [Vallitaleaceae bacterium]
MKKPNFFKKIYLSVTSMPFYTSVIHEHFMKSFLYLILFSLLISLPFAIFTALQTTKLISDIADSFPRFTLSDGTLTFESDEPFVYKNEKDNMIVISDPSGTHDINTLTGYQSAYLLRPKYVILSQAGFAPQSISYKDVAFWTIGSNDLDLLVLFRPFLAAMMAGLNLFLVLLTNLFRSLFACSIVLFIRSFFLVPLNFTQSYKIAIYSMTAPMIVIEIINFLPITLSSNKMLAVFVLLDLVITVNILKYMSKQKLDISL